MDPLFKILAEDERQIEILTAQYKVLKKNIVKETTADAQARTHLGDLILAMKKSNAVIVDHYLGEHKLATTEIDKIVNTHSNI